jgi:hypothetical protein
MEMFGSSNFDDERTLAVPDIPDEIDLREIQPDLVGFAYLESRYGNDREAFTKNTALAFLLLLQETEQTLVVGRDTSLLGQKSQAFLDDILDSLTAERRQPGFNRLFEVLADFAGSTPEFLRALMAKFKHDKNHLLANFSHSPEGRYEFQQRLKKESLGLLRPITEQYVGMILERTPMLHEGGELTELDPDLFYEYCGQFLPLQLDGEYIKKPKPPGISEQLYQRLIDEARFIYRSDTDALLI